MENNIDLRFYKLMEELIVALTDLDGMDPSRINAVLEELCKMFRICKGVTSFYQSLNHERAGRGDHMVCYDSGEDGEVAMSIRIISKATAVIICTVWMPKDAEPLSDLERFRVDLVMRMVLSAVSRSRLQNAVAMLAFHDDKGYWNAREYQRQLAAFNAQGRLAGMAAMHFNLLHFSLVNQEVGRVAGDMAMRNLIVGLENMIGDEGAICRLGGDNFVGLCKKDVLDDILNYLKETPVVYDAAAGKRILIQASVGVYLIPEDFVLHDPGQIMDKIISALQAARNGKKERIVFYHDDLLVSKEKRMRVQQRFPDALRSEEFRVFYQPKVNINTGELTGAEALCRWFRRDQMIPPMEFIPILEETTDICKLDFYMLEHVCRDLRRWLDEGRKAVRVSVNLSRKHMMDIDLLQNIIDIIDRYEIPHNLIEIELTETTTDVEFRDLKRVVGGLQQEGIGTAVDDFGVGYSSLNLLREVPWEVLKIDRSLLPDENNTQKDDGAHAMFRHVVAVAKELGLYCITEGVETEEQVRMLRESRCELAQGFYFDRPLPVEQFETRLDGYKYPIVGDCSPAKNA